MSERHLVHASCVAVPRPDEPARGVLIRGPAGAGKSALSLRLAALGATLVSDDQTVLWRDDDSLLAAAPEALSGVIEARGVGLMRVPAAREARLGLVVELERPAAAGSPPQSRPRLPERGYTHVLGVSLPLILGFETSRLASIIFVLARNGELLDNTFRAKGG